MKILLTEIAGRCGQFTCSELFDSSLYEYVMQRPAEAELLIKHRKDGLYILSGTLQATLNTLCDRCAKEIVLSVNREFRYLLRIGREADSTVEQQCSDEDCDTLYLDEAAIDSRLIVEEQILLAVPLQHLCDNACKGLCKECGCDLNKKKCRCGENNANSPFAILKTLQQK